MERHYPLSPHMTIFKFELNAIMSVMHRATGIILSLAWFGIIMFNQMSILNTGSYFVYTLSALVFSKLFLSIVCLGTIYSLYYHLYNGIRHLIWDAGYALDVQSLTKSGYIVLGLTAVVGTIVFVAVVL